LKKKCKAFYYGIKNIYFLYSFGLIQKNQKIKANPIAPRVLPANASLCVACVINIYLLHIQLNFDCFLNVCPLIQQGQHFDLRCLRFVVPINRKAKS